MMMSFNGRPTCGERQQTQVSQTCPAHTHTRYHNDSPCPDLWHNCHDGTHTPRETIDDDKPAHSNKAHQHQQHHTHTHIHTLTLCISNKSNTGSAYLANDAVKITTSNIGPCLKTTKNVKIIFWPKIKYLYHSFHKLINTRSFQYIYLNNNIYSLFKKQKVCCLKQEYMYGIFFDFFFFLCVLKNWLLFFLLDEQYLRFQQE